MQFEKIQNYVILHSTCVLLHTTNEMDVIAMGKRPTIQMIADRAGVSRGTVDRVLNNRSYVKAEVRKRVLQATEELGYLSLRNFHQNITGGYAPIKLGVIMPNWVGYTKAEFHRGIMAARAELKDFHVDVTICECVTDIPGEVNEYLEKLVEDGVSGIALCALNDLSIQQKIAELAKKNIPVVTFNSDLPNSERICFIGQDYVKSGRIAGELLYKILPKNAKILALVGNLEFDGHRARLDGFCTRLYELGFTADQIDIAETYNDYRITYRKVFKALQETDHLDGIYMANRSVTGCADAIREAGMTGKVRVISHDVTGHTKQLLKEGRVDLTVSQDIYRQGYLPLIILRNLIHKNIHPSEDLNNTAISVVCSENF